VIEGEPGIGKTTILQAAVDEALANGYRLLSCRPAEREASLPFVSLGDLLEPALDATYASLPPPSRMVTISANCAKRRRPPSTCVRPRTD